MTTAAKTTTKPAPQTPEDPAAAALEAPEAHVDRVAMPTLRADGTPMQSPGWAQLVADEGDSES